MSCEQQPTEESPPDVELKSFSNDNLLKLFTHDKWSTASKLKQMIKKQVQKSDDKQEVEVHQETVADDEGDASKNSEWAKVGLPGLVRVGKNPKSAVAYFSFDTAEHRDNGEKVLLASMRYHQRPWEKMEVKASDYSVTHRGASNSAKKRGRDDEASGGPTNNITPWVDVPYAEQIARKHTHCADVLKQIAASRDIELPGGTMPELSQVLESPLQSGYRNRADLTCGFGKNGRPAVGFNAGAMVDGTAVILGVDCAVFPSVPALVERLANAFENFVISPVLDKYNLSCYDKSKATGFWRRMQVRHNIDFHIMVDIEVNPVGVDDATMLEVKALLGTTWWKEALQPGERLVSLQFHTHSGTSNMTPFDTVRTVLYGETATITETVMGMKFTLSPASFFQVNTNGNEVLLQNVIRVAQLDKDNTVLLDLCCGTGSIGICLSPFVKKVIGIEMVAEAVENAVANAKLNGVQDRCEFMQGKLEELLGPTLERLSQTCGSDRIVAILDPPRAGVHQQVVKWIRKCSGIRHLVYVSCDQRALVVDAQRLMRKTSHAFQGVPFQPVEAFGVDLFPSTPHCEMIMAFKR